MPENNDFIKQQQRAVERMREMSAHAAPPINSAHSMPPTPPFIRMPQNPSAQTNPHMTSGNAETENKAVKNEYNSHNPSYDLAVLERLRTEPDFPLILALLLLLWNENADKRLMLALAYIMM